MFFKKKKKEAEKELTNEHITSFMNSGMQDKDIIKKLKSEGYSYDQIEKVMMSSLRDDVQGNPQELLPPQTQGFNPNSNIGPGIQEPLPPINPQESQIYPELQQNPAQIDDFGVSDEEIDNISPEEIVEELVEGVVEDKWKKFDQNISQIKNELGNLKDAMAEIEKKPSEGKVDVQGYEDKMKSLDSKIDDISVRVGGLEKAFKQFLPSLTSNIENLSKMIHEMKQKDSV